MTCLSILLAFLATYDHETIGTITRNDTTLVSTWGEKRAKYNVKTTFLSIVIPKKRMIGWTKLNKCVENNKSYTVYKRSINDNK